MSIERMIRHSLAYESFRWWMRQFQKEAHYPAPVLERIAYTPANIVEKSLYYTGARSMEGLVMPTFLGVGAMKCGTTWLFGQLGAHPDIYMPPLKEMHYFSWHWHRSLKYYSRQLEAGKGKAIGDFSVDYGGIHLYRIRFIKKVMPNVRLLYMMRNPVDRVWSHAKQELMFRTARSFDEVRDFEFFRRFKLRNTRYYTRYLSDIDRWTSIFPKEQLFIGFYDDVKLRPQELVTDVFKHIGVTTDLDWDTIPLRTRFMEGPPSPPMPDKYREFLQNMYRDDIEKLYQRFGDKVAAWRC